MRRLATLGVAALVVLLIVLFWWSIESSSAPERPFETQTKRIEGAPMCPWREPERDLERFFGSQSRYEKETRILSGLRTELAVRLGRNPTAEENSLYIYRVIKDGQPAGAVVTRRVRGEYGAIEIVLAVSQTGRVLGLRLQRQREPEAIAAAIESTAWLEAFRGKTAQDGWKLGGDVPDVPADARNSAQSIIDAVRDVLILIEVASNPGVVTRPHH